MDTRWPLKYWRTWGMDTERQKHAESCRKLQGGSKVQRWRQGNITKRGHKGESQGKAETAEDKETYQKVMSDEVTRPETPENSRLRPVEHWQELLRVGSELLGVTELWLGNSGVVSEHSSDINSGRHCQIMNITFNSPWWVIQYRWLAIMVEWCITWIFWLLWWFSPDQ